MPRDEYFHRRPQRGSYEFSAREERIYGPPCPPPGGSTDRGETKQETNVNCTKGRCGHDVPAIGAPGSIAREQAERSLCADCLSVFNEGQNANDHNKRVWRTRRGQAKFCPYDAESPQARFWREGYNYRDMVNDG